MVMKRNESVSSSGCLKTSTRKSRLTSGSRLCLFQQGLLHLEIDKATVLVQPHWFGGGPAPCHSPNHVAQDPGENPATCRRQNLTGPQLPATCNTAFPFLISKETVHSFLLDAVPEDGLFRLE